MWSFVIFMKQVRLYKVTQSFYISTKWGLEKLFWLNVHVSFRFLGRSEFSAQVCEATNFHPLCWQCLGRGCIALGCWCKGKSFCLALINYNDKAGIQILMASLPFFFLSSFFSRYILALPWCLSLSFCVIMYEMNLREKSNKNRKLVWDCSMNNE